MAFGFLEIISWSWQFVHDCWCTNGFGCQRRSGIGNVVEIRIEIVNAVSHLFSASLNLRSPLIGSALMSSPIGSGTNFSLVPPTKHCTSSSNAAAHQSCAAAFERSLWFVVVLVLVVPFWSALLAAFKFTSTLVDVFSFVGWADASASCGVIECPGSWLAGCNLGNLRCSVTSFWLLRLDISLEVEFGGWLASSLFFESSRLVVPSSFVSMSLVSISFWFCRIGVMSSFCKCNGNHDGCGARIRMVQFLFFFWFALGLIFDCSFFIDDDAGWSAWFVANCWNCFQGQCFGNKWKTISFCWSSQCFSHPCAAQRGQEKKTQDKTNTQLTFHFGFWKAEEWRGNIEENKTFLSIAHCNDAKSPMKLEWMVHAAANENMLSFVHLSVDKQLGCLCVQCEIQKLCWTFVIATSVCWLAPPEQKWKERLMLEVTSSSSLQQCSHGEIVFICLLADFKTCWNFEFAEKCDWFACKNIFSRQQMKTDPWMF